MIGRKPLLPGNDHIHQIGLITDITGTPGEEDTVSQLIRTTHTITTTTTTTIYRPLARVKVSVIDASWG
eukprot:SAG31_NODE_11573_length_1016_cov_2.455834_1_plen_68_part_10